MGGSAPEGRCAAAAAGGGAAAAATALLPAPQVTPANPIHARPAADPDCNNKTEGLWCQDFPLKDAQADKDGNANQEGVRARGRRRGHGGDGRGDRRGRRAWKGRLHNVSGGEAGSADMPWLTR